MDKIVFRSQVDKILEKNGFGGTDFDLIAPRRNIFTLKELVPAKLILYDKEGKILEEIESPTKTKIVDVLTKMSENK